MHFHGGAERCLQSYLCGMPVLPAGCDVGDDTGVAFFAHIDAIHFNDALTRVKACDCRNGAFWETGREIFGQILR